MIFLRPLALAVLAGTSAAAAPLDLAYPPGTSETLSRAMDPGTYELPMGKASPGRTTVKTLTGRVHRRVLRVPTDRSDTLALLRAVRDQLTQKGYEILFECETRACGGFDFRFSTDVDPPPEMEFSLADFRQLSARNALAGTHASILISRTTRGGFVQTTFVEAGQRPAADLEPVATPLTDARPAPGDLAGQLDDQGSAVLEAIDFASGSTELGAEARASLAELAQLMIDRPDLSLIIVGHTDTTGSLDSNIAVSRARARAVASALATDHGIDPARLEAEGAGYLAPRASNATDAGRARNRRVEVVAR